MSQLKVFIHVETLPRKLNFEINETEVLPFAGDRHQASQTGSTSEATGSPPPDWFFEAPGSPFLSPDYICCTYHTDYSLIKPYRCTGLVCLSFGKLHMSQGRFYYDVAHMFYVNVHSF